MFLGKSKSVFMFILLLFVIQCYAQMDQPIAKSKIKINSRFSAGIGLLIWSERVRLLQNQFLDSGYIQYTGTSFFLDHTSTIRRGGYGFGGLVSTGRATIGDLANLTSFQNSQSDRYSLLAGYGRFFYRPTGVVQLGSSVYVFYRQLQLKSNLEGIELQTKKNISIFPSLDLRMILFPNFEISQNFGFLSFNNEIMINWSGHYRF